MLKLFLFGTVVLSIFAESYFFVDFAVKLIHEFQCSLNCKNQYPIVLIRSVATNLFKEWEFILGVFWGDNMVGIIN